MPWIFFNENKIEESLKLLCYYLFKESVTSPFYLNLNITLGILLMLTAFLVLFGTVHFFLKTIFQNRTGSCLFLEEKMALKLLEFQKNWPKHSQIWASFTHTPKALSKSCLVFCPESVRIWKNGVVYKKKCTHTLSSCLCYPGLSVLYGIILAQTLFLSPSLPPLLLV